MSHDTLAEIGWIGVAVAILGVLLWIADYLFAEPPFTCICGDPGILRANGMITCGPCKQAMREIESERL